MDFEKGSMENIAITNTKYSVDLLNKYPHVIFVFGDNMIRKGKGGQAIIRDWLQHALEETPTGSVQSVAPARRSFAFDRREVDVKVDFWKKNQGYITHSIFELEE